MKLVEVITLITCIEKIPSPYTIIDHFNHCHKERRD